MTSNAPDDDIQLVPDAAAPDPVDPDTVIEVESRSHQPSPLHAGLLPRPAGMALDPMALFAPDVDSERARALAAAALHLRCWQRRHERDGETAPEWARRHLDEVAFCVVDLETTGTRPGYGDEILEIGAVRLMGREFGREFSTLVDPLRPISPAARAVHGIRDADVRGAPRLPQVLPYLVEMTRDSVLVFHNAGFDLGFIQRALVEHERQPLASPVLDTVLLARRLLGGRVGLGTAAARLGIGPPHLHRALPDARLTALLLLELLRVLRDAGAHRLDQVPGLVRRAARPRRRALPRPDLLAQRLERAIRSGEPLALAYRGARGVAPYELRVRALRLLGGMQLVACDPSGSPEFVLELAAIERLAPAP